jgi:hypothetical protein
MARVRIRDVVDQRIAMLQTMAPSLTIRYDLREEGGEEYGVVSTVDQDTGLKGLDFLETEESWQRRNALLQYAHAVSEGFRVTVIVPDSSYPALSDLLSRRQGLSAVVLNSYGQLGIKVVA